MVKKCTVYKEIKKCQRNLFLAKLLKWRHNHSQSPVFGLTVLNPTGSEIWCFWYIKTPARKIAIEIFVLLFLSVHCGNFVEQIKTRSLKKTFNRALLTLLRSQKHYVICSNNVLQENITWKQLRLRDSKLAKCLGCKRFYFTFFA